MKRKMGADLRKVRKNKSKTYYRDGEVVGECVIPCEDGNGKEVYRTVMVLCPDWLLREIDVLSDFNYVDRSDFIAAAIHRLLDYLDARMSDEVTDAQSVTPAGELDTDDILMSRERYPYEDDDEDLGILFAAEDDGEE